MRVQDLSKLVPSRPMGPCGWCCQRKGFVDVHLGSGKLVFFDGDLCHLCLAELIQRYPTEDAYCDELISAGVAPDLLVLIMKTRLVRRPPTIAA